jgi:hypothetical protein
MDGTCPEDGVCPSKREGQECNSHLDCGVRAYCHSEEKLCRWIHHTGESCKTDYQCKNSQGCFNGVCTDYYSLNVGTDLSNSTSEYKEKLCVSETELKNKCYARYYDTTMQPNKDGMVECNPGDNKGCSYVDSEGKKSVSNCNCGYNGENKAYCIRGFDSIYILKQIRQTVTGKNLH